MNNETKVTMPLTERELDEIIYSLELRKNQVQSLIVKLRKYKKGFRMVDND